MHELVVTFPFKRNTKRIRHGKIYNVHDDIPPFKLFTRQTLTNEVRTKTLPK